MAKLGVGVTSDQSTAAIQVDSTTQGGLPVPRLTTAQRDAIASPATGLLIYNTTTNAYNYYDGSNWTAVGGGSPTGAAGGDLTGTYPNPTVDALLGRPLGLDTPTEGQVLMYTGSAWRPRAVTAAAAGGGTGEIFLTAAGGWPSTTNGCAANVKVDYTANRMNLYALDFDKDSIEYAEWTAWMPIDWNAGTLTYKAAWTAVTGTAGQTTFWNLQGRSYADDDAIDQAWGSAVEVSDAFLAGGDVHYTAESSAVTLAGTPAAGELVQFRAWNNAPSGTLGYDARLLGIKIFYTKS